MLFLASASPRRKELLSMLDIEFDVVVSDCEEVITCTEPSDVVTELSLKKAKAVAEKAAAGTVIIGADTVVSFEENILGKPSDMNEAYEMIHLLQDQVHQVYTGVTIIFGKLDKITSFYVKTDVIVANMDEEEIRTYIRTGESYDKAGSYGIQGFFGKYVKGIIGDYNNVVGLPVHRLYEELRKEKVL